MTRRHCRTYALTLCALHLLQFSFAFLSRFSPSPRIPAPTAPLSTTEPEKRFALYYGRMSDMRVVLGSESSADNATMHDEYDPSSVTWDEWQQSQAQRRQHVEQLLLNDTKTQRKRKLWGDFANATSPEQLNMLIKQQEDEWQAQQQRQAELAARSGVSMQILELEDYDDLDDDVDSSTSNPNIKISLSKGKPGGEWFSNVDEELAAEWEALTSGDAQRNSNDDDSDDDTTEDSNDASTDSAIVEKKSGKIKTRSSMAGVRVGSAGGWSLEVFPGDFVVHRKYGIGRFERTCLRPKTKLTPEEQQARDERRGELLTIALRERQANNLSTSAADIQEIRSKFGTDDDTDLLSNPQTTVLEIAYADAVVHVPVDRAYRLSRYRAGDAVVKPKLSRVRGGAWAKAKQKVQETTLELAQDVLALYATRETLQRMPFDPSIEPKVREFESTFKYTPTPDQQKCFEDVENDMVWRSKSMDRLCCGDVGFGKTEVAFRAIYRALANGRQAALLSPTGVLAAQHYKNALSRMGPFNITIGLLRGGMHKNSRAGREIRQEIADGTCQLIVGTHALLSKDLKFNDLGLLVVDEEQRFGVKQKERLKLICNGVDVLTLSATPIPRTLQMSLSGIRDTSTIRSPPPMRKPTITYVQEYSDDIVRTAIEQELARGGQCYYVVPRISMLEEAEAVMKRLFPDIRIIQAHGRMQRNGAEENVAEFAQGNYDVLLATTVIENGVDIPTVNTIIVQNSQNFGVSTLYQLRGRVGRSDLQAYAYFLHSDESITEQAALRLQAIGELNELGSGFDVANRDLEIRGAGSLLGTEQSGMAAKVGFDLYMRMLKKSIRKLRGLDLPLLPRTNILLKTNGTPDTFTLDAKYIPDDTERHVQESKARLAESTAQLVNITAAWKEEYGPISAALQSKLKTLHLHACTRRLGIDLVGLVQDDNGNSDCVLRSPGLRPRHWAMIVKALPKRTSPAGLNVVFPARFTATNRDETLIGGVTKVPWRKILTPEELGVSSNDMEGDDEEDWDAIDQEESEAIKDIASAMSFESMDDVDIEQSPRFVIPDITSNDKKAVDKILKVLLPISKVVYEIQEVQARNARAAAELRDRQDMLKQRKKTLESREMANKYGMQAFDYHE